MQRKFIPFDEQIIRKELDSLPDRDAAKLVAVMEHYEQCGRGNPAPAQIDEYPGGIMRIRHAKSAYQGRAVYFSVERGEGGIERLIVLTVYKKEGTKVPASVLTTAQRRKQQWEQNR